jgi:hypothetical protein
MTTRGDDDHPDFVTDFTGIIFNLAALLHFNFRWMIEHAKRDACRGGVGFLTIGMLDTTPEIFRRMEGQINVSAAAQENNE